jgi:hypothetical protein
MVASPLPELAYLALGCADIDETLVLCTKVVSWASTAEPFPTPDSGVLDDGRATLI